MTILQHSVFYSLLGDGALQACGVRLLRTRRPGRLVVKSGRAWITRQGDLDDHVLSAGDAMDLRAHEQIVVEPWEGGTAVRLSWCGAQRRAAFLRGAEALRAGALRWLARCPPQPATGCWPSRATPRPGPAAPTAPCPASNRGLRPARSSSPR
jgi:hypothetical protein